eukprot:CAMPEP_0206572534 /NCGR_PEP_ID=MMETSP0325_2-20121206/28311_1 /ASSEMBLY_ACC=CAM_ASM_000347 /TAXON_ID=2866 /ORGANISM="Crypthecodinium cohnii, Strain Seligo" /LENGTH=237 /DNA_ID=CAMNT_0054076773 /DNA_START=40 /DNA_END=749 /DNA_ORIENTATION=+
MFTCCCSDENANDEAVFVKALATDAVVLPELATPNTEAPVAAKGFTSGLKKEAEPEKNVTKAGSPLAFKATLKKAGVEAALGWSLDVLDPRHLVVCRIITGQKTPLEEYNNTAPEAEQIREGDYIIGVNGMFEKSDKMSEVLRSSDTFDLTLCRPEHFEAKVTKNGSSLGLDLKYGPGGSSLLLEGIRDGALKTCAPQVKVGDRIVGVNGVTGTPYVLMQAIQDSPVLNLKFARPSA